MGIKKSLMLSDQTVDYIQSTIKPEYRDKTRWSNGVNGAFSDLTSLVRLSMPELTSADWELILNVYAGSFLDDTVFPLRTASDIMDHFGAVDISVLEKNVQETIRKVHSLSQVQQYAMTQVIRRFWARDWKDFKGSFSELIHHIISNI